MRKVSINADIGEGFPWDRQLMEVVTQVNVCCGLHAESPAEALETAHVAAQKGLIVVAHPSYPDREFFGRRTWTDWSDVNREFLRQSLFDQIRPMLNLITAIKPHGALYTDAVADLRPAALVGSAALEFELAIIGFPCQNFVTAAHLAGVPLILEGFIDRRYEPDGTLVPRSRPDAMLSAPQEIATQVLALAQSVDTLCIHGDHEGCLEMAHLARKTLEKAGYEVGD